MATNNDVLRELQKLTGLASLQAQGIAAISANVTQILVDTQKIASVAPATSAQAIAAAVAASGQQAGAPARAQAQAQPLAKTRIGRFVQSVRARARTGRRIGRKVGLATGRLAGASRSGAASLGRVAGVAGGAIGAIAGIVTGFVEANKAVGAWTAAALDSKKRLAEYSGQMAAIFAEKEFRDAARDRQTAANTAASTGRLMESDARRRDAARPISDAFDNAVNNVLSFLNDALSEVLESVNSIGRFLGVLSDEKPTPEGIVGMMPDVQREMDRIEREAKGMMEKARAAAAKFGVAGPIGAAPPGRLGIGGP